MSKSPINDVSDTALWVASYRAKESRRPSPLFCDPYAEVLAGPRGFEIAKNIRESAYTGWTVAIRTKVIDEYIQTLVREGITTVINLGAGLDTRPYRIELPSHLRWVEVDYPHVLQYKEEKLSAEKPNCHLERIGVNLADPKTRQNLFSRLASENPSCLILTEGVIPYLSNDQVAELASDLRAHPEFQYWITEYLSPRTIKFLHSKARRKVMQNAPFLFNPPDWFAFFVALGWKPRETCYLGEEGNRRNRPTPFPWWVRLLKPLMPAETQTQLARLSGYILFAPFR